MLISLLIIPCLAFEQVNVKISLNVQNTEISKVFRSIEKQSGFAFYFSGGTIDPDALVSIKVKETPISKVLDELLQPFKVEYQYMNKSIILKKRRLTINAENNQTPLDTNQLKLIKGKILDNNGKGMAGVTISVKGTQINAISDENGNFQLNTYNSNPTLLLSSIGYEPQEIKVKNSTLINIMMKERVTELQKIEVLSTGYQDIPKERATGSFSYVDNELFNRKIGTNVLDRLNDVVPGLLKTTPTNANPLSGYQIRGISTINAATSPLLVVDNFIFEGNPSVINPNDIESVSVLKDAAAASIWGVRAGNGVIVITTKKGRQNRRATLSFNSNFTITKKPNIASIPSIPSKDIVELEKRRFKEGYYNSDLTGPYSFQPLPAVAEILYKNKKGEISDAETKNLLYELENTDIKSEISKHLIQNSISQQYSLNITGGSDKNQYFASLGYDKSIPSDINTKNERLTIRWNNSWQPIKRLNISTEINWSKADYSSQNDLVQGQDKLLNYTYNKLADEHGNPLPIQSIYRSLYTDTINSPGLLDWRFYPLNEAKFGQTKRNIKEIRLVGSISYQISKSISASVQYQYQNNNGDNIRIRSLNLFETRDMINKYVQSDPQTGKVVYPIPKGDIYDRTTSQLSSWNFRGKIDFNKSFGLNNLIAVAAIEARETNTEQNANSPQYGFNPSTNTFQNVLYGTWNERPYEWPVPLITYPSALNGTINRFGSYLANASYTYDERYIISASGRVDQSNFFGAKANDRIVPLWSAGIAWNIYNESFFKSKWTDKLTLRFTYGFSGNVNPGVSPFPTASYRIGALPTNLPYARITTAPNPILKWEKVKQINIAMDFSFLNKKLSGTLEFYNKYGLNLISPIKSAPSSGFLEYNGNNASLKTTGMDLNILNTNKVGQLKISNVLILSYNTNKVTQYVVSPPSDFVTPRNYTYEIPVIGKPIDKLYTYYWAGLNAENGDAQFYLDGKAVGSNEIREARLENFKYSGRIIPSWTGAWRTELEWKTVSVSIGLNYRFKSVFLRSSFDGRIGIENNFKHQDYLSAWKKPGDERFTNVPGFADYYSDQRYAIYNESNILVEKGDIIRLQDIKINCDIGSYLRHIKTITRCHLFVYIDNIGTIWKQSKYDPQTSGAFTYNQNLTSYTLGINVSL